MNQHGGGARRIVGGLACAAVVAVVQGCAVPTVRQARFEVDEAKVAIVERAARNNGVSVYWINPPLRAVEDKQAD